MDDLTAGFSCCDKTAGKKFISGIFCQIVRLTCQERFVYFHTAFEYFYVCRNLISGFQKDQIVDDQFLCGNTPFLSFTQDNRFAFCQNCKFVNGFFRPDLLNDTDDCIDQDNSHKHGIFV